LNPVALENIFFVIVSSRSTFHREDSACMARPGADLARSFNHSTANTTKRNKQTRWDDIDN